jgi:hypothetical protein
MAAADMNAHGRLAGAGGAGERVDRTGKTGER